MPSTRKMKPAVIATFVACVVVAGALALLILHPGTVVRGDNVYLLGPYSLEEQGLLGLVGMVEQSQDMPDEYTVAAFEATLDGLGGIERFTLSLDAYEHDVYCGTALYVFDGFILSYDPPTAATKSSLVRTRNPNSELSYLDEQIKRIPLAEQLRASGLNRYIVTYRPHTLVEEGTPVFDGRDGTPFPVLGPDEYRAGAGGTSDGATNVVIRLYEGQSTVGGLQYLYMFDPIEQESAVGNPVATMECDYAISGGALSFTKNYGQTWIESDLTEEELSETLDFYRNGIYLPPSSVFVSTDDELPIAFIYDGKPTVKTTFDDGATWNTVVLATAADFNGSVTKRALGFTSPTFAYAALGTDWSMGSGEHKLCYFSFDGGRTWTEKALPLTNTPNVLMDMAMADEQHGLVALDAGADVFYPLLFATTDTGDLWEAVELPYENLPIEVQYLSNLDSLTFENGLFTLVMGQGDLGTAKATFTANDLLGPWELGETSEASIHQIG